MHFIKYIRIMSPTEGEGDILFLVRMSPTEEEGDILFLVRILLASALASASALA